MELSFQLFRSLWFWSGIYLVGKNTVPQYWKLFYQQWSRDWLFFSGEGREARWSAFSIFFRGCSWNQPRPQEPWGRGWVETLALAIRQNPEIIGIKIGGEETKLFQYADDTTVVLSDIDSAQALFNLLEVFKNLSGLVINSSKLTECGSGRLEIKLGIKWPDEPIKALGVYYSYDIKLLHEKNFIERLDSLKKRINIWSSRGLSIYGKVTIIKSLIIPKFVFISWLLTVLKEIVKELNQMIFKFLWKGTNKVTRLSTINEYENGGLKMIDLESTDD